MCFTGIQHSVFQILNLLRKGLFWYFGDAVHDVTWGLVLVCSWQYLTQQGKK